jgi:hypothetical protein
MALKEMADKSGLAIGMWANLLIIAVLYNAEKPLSELSPEVQKALTADALAAIGELFKTASLETIRNTSIADLYKNLLSQPETK